MGKKMKIAFLSFYSGEVYRGVETFVHELANRLVDSGCEVIVYQNGPRLKNSKYETVSIGFKIDWSKRKNYIPFLNYYALQVRSFTANVLRRIDKDVDIIFPTNGQWQSLLCKIWAVRNRKRMVISGQSGPGMDDRINLYTFPNAFVGLTDFQVSWAKRTNSFIKSMKIANGVDLEEFSKGVKPFSVDLPRPVVLCVAAFDYWKRLDLVIKAVARLNASLLLVGRGEDEDKLRKLGENLLSGRFRILSFSHDQMPKVYTACDLFTYATVPWESFGIVMVEAMASGLGVVATDDPIRREIVGDAGLFVDPTDTEKYAQTLEKALKLKWNDKPRKQVEKFDWDEIARKYEQLFLELTK